MHSVCAELIAECIAAQRVLGAGLLQELRKGTMPAPVMDGSVSAIVADARRLRRIAASLRQRHKRGLPADSSKYDRVR
jgi:hypothetical protein